MCQERESSEGNHEKLKGAILSATAPQSELRLSVKKTNQARKPDHFLNHKSWQRL